MPKRVSAVEVELIGGVPFEELLLRYRVFDGQDVVIPAAAPPGRSERLWESTCFELFVRPSGGNFYVEFNASPSGQWAAYAFDSYRRAMRNLPVAIVPHVEFVEAAALCYDVDVNFSDLPPGPLHIGLSAVIEETDGTKSYWALRHPPGPPNFHHPDCFALALPPPA